MCFSIDTLMAEEWWYSATAESVILVLITTLLAPLVGYLARLGRSR